MKLCAIIAEFNPFTNGHKYLIDEAKRLTGLDVAVILSGDVVQRGQAAILAKQQRARIAIAEGATIVLQMPIVYTLSSAKNFARGAIKCLSKIGAVTHLAFGIDCNKSSLIKISNLLQDKTSDIFKVVKQKVKVGQSYSTSVYDALLNYVDERELNEAFSSPNNILAIEYLLAISEFGSTISPVFVRRTDQGYNSMTISQGTLRGKQANFASATKVRSLLEEGRIAEVEDLVPASSFEELKSYSGYSTAAYDAIVLASLRGLDKKQLLAYYDYNPSNASVIAEQCQENASTEGIINAAESKSLRRNRIGRLVVYPYIGLTKAVYDKLDKTLSSLKVLAVDKQKREQFRLMKKESQIKLLSSKEEIGSLPAPLRDMDSRASILHQLVLNRQPQGSDLTEFI